MESEEKIIEERKEAFLNFFKKNPNVWIYGILVLLVIFSFWIRTLNVDGLRDITTGEYTLGPDLDPFLFLRWAEYIVENGNIMHIDTMRYVPLGYDTENEMMFLSYLIAWFHKGLSAFGLTESVVQSAVYFPAIMFMLTVVAFFLFARRVGEKSLGIRNAGIMALIASFFLIVIPSLLPRTIAGIPEKESVGFFFMFLAFYFFLEGWNSKEVKGHVIWGVLAGLATAGMALIWGGYVYILVTITLTILIAYFLGQFDKNKMILSIVWIVVAFFVMNFFSLRYDVNTLLVSTGTSLPIFMILLVLADFYFGKRIYGYFQNWKIGKIPRPVLVLVSIAIIAILLMTLFFGVSYLHDKVKRFSKPLIDPVNDRLGVTVAENRQPYFSEWANEFGPLVYGAPVFFWLFLISSVYLYYSMVHMFDKKEKIIMTLGYSFFLFAIIFSRYSATSLFNGTNFASLSFYILGVLVLIGTFGYYYFREYFANQEKLKSIDMNLIFLFALFFFSVISARGSVRTIMVLAPAVSLIVPYMMVKFVSKIIKEIKNE